MSLQKSDCDPFCGKFVVGCKVVGTPYDAELRRGMSIPQGLGQFTVGGGVEENGKFRDWVAGLSREGLEHQFLQVG